jgi:hypothetical protein
MVKTVPYFGLKVSFDTKKGGLRKSKLLDLHQAAIFLTGSLLIVKRAFQGLKRALFLGSCFCWQRPLTEGKISRITLIAVAFLLNIR